MHCELGTVDCLLSHYVLQVAAALPHFLLTPQYCTEESLATPSAMLCRASED